MLVATTAVQSDIAKAVRKKNNKDEKSNKVAKNSHTCTHTQVGRKRGPNGQIFTKDEDGQRREGVGQS